MHMHGPKGPENDEHTFKISISLLLTKTIRSIRQMDKSVLFLFVYYIYVSSETVMVIKPR